jgi:hypothetical protein
LDNCQVQNPDGTTTQLPNCVGDANASPSTPDDKKTTDKLDEVVVSGHRTKMHVFKHDDPCSGAKCVYNDKPPENAVRIENDGSVTPVNATTPFEGTVCGKKVTGLTFGKGAFSGASAVAHDHPSGTSRIPGPGDYQIPVAYGIANYVISDNSVMVVEKVGGSPRIRVIENAPLLADELKELKDQIKSWMNGSCK